MAAPADSPAELKTLFRFAYLAVATALVTIALKTTAWAITGSTGLLSDAVESLVNLAAAILAVLVLRWAAKPPDDEHRYGHAKAEYISAGAEGAMIIAAAGSIAWIAIGRLIDPAPIEDAGIGLAISGAATAINLIVGLKLLNAGREYRSLTLEADGRHLLTDVWTSFGVIAGVAAVAITGWDRLDALIALLIAVNIVITGMALIRRFTGGLLDRAMPDEDLERIDAVLDSWRERSVSFHALRTRQAGRRAFASVHVLVPGDWSVQRGHDLVEEIEADLRGQIPGLVIFTHLEPREDPLSQADRTLDRTERHPPADGSRVFDRSPADEGD